MPRQATAISPAIRRRYGVEPGWGFGIEKRVEWADVDAFSHVNHVVYLRWCEEARNVYLKEMGLPRITPDTTGVVIKDVFLEYRQPLGFENLVLVTARTMSMRNTSFRMEYAVWKNGMSARGEATCVLMISNTGERVPIPEGIRAAMAGRDGASADATARAGS